MFTDLHDSSRSGTSFDAIKYVWLSQYLNRTNNKKTVRNIFIKSVFEWVQGVLSHQKDLHQKTFQIKLESFTLQEEPIKAQNTSKVG